MAFDAILYDGVTAEPRPVTVEPGRQAIEISDDGQSECIEAALLRRGSSGPDELRLSRTDRAGWRLVVPAAYAGELDGLLRKEERYGRWIDRIGLAPALLVLGGAAAAAVTIGYMAPQWIAPQVPLSWEQNVGDAIVGDFGDNRCRNAEGQHALEAMVERLEPGATSGPDRIRVAALDIDMFNAAALPGGHIIVFNGAVTETEDADELAGIMAHEIAHLRRRHVTEALIRELGIGALIRLFAGDIGANAEQLVALSYTREHEAEADADAIRMLDRAGISPLPTARLFERLAGDEEDGAFYSAEFLNSHPLSSGRARRFAAAHDQGRRYSPTLTEAQSDALFNICWDGERESVSPPPVLRR